MQEQVGVVPVADVATLALGDAGTDGALDPQEYDALLEKAELGLDHDEAEALAVVCGP